LYFQTDRCHEYDRLQFLRKVERGSNQCTRDESEGNPVTVERLAPPKLIAKEFADVCTEARNLRFDKKKRLEFENSANAAPLEGLDLANQRKTGLVLVENCTAWLYLHRREDAYKICKSAVSRLLQQASLYRER
ncbi:hypothetical protein COOONC_14474, partial [Cooperia oncophora]